MIIDNFHVIRIRVAPRETDPPLVIDPNAVLAAPVAFQCLQAISRRNSQVGEPPRPMQVQQLSPGNALNRTEAWDQPVFEKQRSIGAPEGPDHTF
jgi:hypothetical protein